MSIKIEVYLSGQDVLKYVDIMSINVTESEKASGDSLDLDFYIVNNEIEKPKPGNPIELKINGNTEFKGVISNTNDDFINPVTMMVKCSCVDFTFMLNRKLVAKQEYAEQTCRDRIIAMVNEFASEFGSSFSYVDTGLIAPKEGYDYENIGSIIDRMCEATGYSWYVDFDKHIHFFAKETYESPLENNTLDLDSTTEIGGVTISEDISSIANVIVVKDFAQKSDAKMPYKQVADGQQTFFNLPMEPFDVEGVDVRVSSDGGINWRNYVPTLDPLDGSNESIEGAEGMVYVCIVNWGIRFPTVDMPLEGDYIDVEYDYVMPPTVAVFFDRDSINEMARREGTDGEHYMMVSLPDYRVSDVSTIEFYGQMMLDRHAWPEISGSFETFMPGWSSKQSFYLTSEVRDIYDIKKWVKNGRSVKEPVRVVVKSVTKKIVKSKDGEDVVYTTKVEFSNKTV